MGIMQSFPSSVADTRSQKPNRFEQNLEALAKIKSAYTHRSTETSSILNDKLKENQHLLRHLFKRLDPTLSRVDTNVTGEIQVSLKYDPNTSHLLINVIRCRDLNLDGVTWKAAEPFVGLHIYPDPENIGVKQTSICHEALMPVFNEIFAFHIPAINLNQTKLILKLLDYDVVQDEFLGEVIISLSDFSFEESPIHTAWYSLQPEKDITISGEIDVSLAYSLPHSLSVTIHKASNLKPNPSTNSSHPIVKLGIPGVEKMFTTKVQPYTLNPQFEETFTFEVPQEEFCFRTLVLTVLDESSPTEYLLGHAVIDLDTFSPDSEFRVSIPLADLRHSDRIRSRWFQSVQVQEFREALWAHSFFNYPLTIFQNHSGRKTVRLTCRAAGGAKAKIEIVNGIPIL